MSEDKGCKDCGPEAMTVGEENVVDPRDVWMARMGLGAQTEVILCNVVAWRVPAKQSFSGQMAMRVKNVASLVARPRQDGGMAYAVVEWFCDEIDIPIKNISGIGKASDKGEHFHTQTFSEIARVDAATANKILNNT